MRKLLTLLFIFSIKILLFAQLQDPVKWIYEVKPLKNYGEYELVFKATIEKGWSIYAPNRGCRECPMSSSLDFSRDYHYELLGDYAEAGKKKVEYDDVFKIEVGKYVEKVTFKQRIKTSPETDTILGFICYAACNKTSCLPARDFTFNIKLPSKNKIPKEYSQRSFAFRRGK